MGKVLFSEACVCPPGGTTWSLVTGSFRGYPSPVTAPVQSPVLGPTQEGTQTRIGVPPPLTRTGVPPLTVQNQDDWAVRAVLPLAFTQEDFLVLHKIVSILVETTGCHYC